jgi:hypothetical protein
VNDIDRRRREAAAGPYVVWTDYGCEGWAPKSFATLKEALEAEHYGSFVITRLVEYEIVEKSERT